MNIFELVNNCDVLYNMRVNGHPKPFGIMGPPGGGKTTIITTEFAYKLAQVTGKKVAVLTDILSTREAPDMRGLPIIVKTNPEYPVYRYAVPDLVDRIWRMAEDDDTIVIVLLDEFTNSKPDVQAVSADLIQRYFIGEYELPKNAWIIATGNRVEDNSLVQRQAAMLTNRMCWYDVELPLEYYLKYARFTANLPPINLAFAERFPEYFAKAIPPRNGAFNTYRSFTEFSLYLKSFNEVRGRPAEHVEDSPWTRATATGMIGDAATLAFFNYAKVADLIPSRADIIKNPMTARMPGVGQIDAQYAAMSLAIDIALGNVLDAVPAVKYILRIPTTELVTNAMVLLQKNVRGGITMNNPDAAEWCANHKALITAAYA